MKNSIKVLNLLKGHDFKDFNLSVAVEEDLALIGIVSDLKTKHQIGVAYIFKKNKTWELIQQLIPDEKSPINSFGIQVYFESSIAKVIAFDHLLLENRTYTFQNINSGWRQIELFIENDKLNQKESKYTNKSLSPSEILDFLTQNVCVDSNDNIVEIDPVECPIDEDTNYSTRDLRKGERTPYYKIDQLGVQAMVSFLSETPDNNNLWVNTFDWGHGDYRDANSNPMYNDDGTIARQAYLETTDDFSSPSRHDIMDSILKNNIAGNSTAPIVDWIAISGTQRHYWLDDCSLKGVTGAWLLFPENTVDNTLGSYVSELIGVPIDSNDCPSNRSKTITSWIKGLKEYTNGQVLPTITVVHTCGNDLNITNDCYEKYFFTKEYGFTRWEQWQNDANEQRPTTPNPMGCSDGWESNNHMWRKFCRDFAQVEFLPNNLTWNPKSYPLDKAFGKGNILINGDFAYRDTTGWNRHYSSNRPTEWNVNQAASNNYIPYNHSLNVSCSGCSGNYRGAIYQDVNRDSNITGKMSWGGDFKNTSKNAIDVKLILFQIGISGNISNEVTNFTIPSNEIYSYDGGFMVDANTTKFRWQLYVQTLGAEVAVDNVYLTNY